MNHWLIEKSMYQVDAAIDLIELASEVEQSIRIGPESLRERLVRNAWTVYRQACNLIAYATGGFPEEMHQQASSAFDEGANAMKQFANALAASPPDGWDLPNPAVHSAVVAVERPRSPDLPH